MIQAEKLAKAIEEELNNNIHTKAFNKHFKIFANVGDYQETFDKINGISQQQINGVIRQASGEYTSVKDVNNVFINFTFECAIQQEFVDELQVILSSYAESLIGNTFNDGEWTYLITPTPLTTGVAMNTCALGSTIPISMTLSVQQILKGIIQNQEKWKINGKDINVLSNQVSSARTTKSSIKVGESETKIINQYNTQSITLTIPFVNNDICKELVNDILGGNKDKVYSISMEDGITNGLSGNYVMTMGQRSAESGRIVSIQCVFQYADELIV